MPKLPAITPAMHRLLWAMAAGDDLVYQDDGRRNPFWRLKRSGKKVDHRTASRAEARGWLYGTVVRKGLRMEYREFTITAAGRVGLSDLTRSRRVNPQSEKVTDGQDARTWG